MAKYNGRKILEVRMIDLVWQKPETINSHPFIVKKIQADWERFCVEKEDQIIELYFRGSEEYQK